MIFVSFIKKRNNIVGFNIEGHSGYAESGSDIVCSAVSAVSITTGNGITEVLGVEPEIHMEDGFLNLNINNNTHAEIEKCQVLLKTMLLGFESIMESYGDYINVTIVEEV